MRRIVTGDLAIVSRLLGALFVEDEQQQTRQEEISYQNEYR